jgi:hypothetical protein
MSDQTKKEEHPNQDLQNKDTGTEHGVAHGIAQEESKGVPDSGRHESESAPLHSDKSAAGAE